MTFAATQSGPAYRPDVGDTAWLVRVESAEPVGISQVTPRTETAMVIPHRIGGLPTTALWEDLHATEEQALAHLEHRAASINAYVKSRRAGKEAA